jgi:hypothetical protein
MKKKHTMLYKTLNRALSMMRPHNTMAVLVFTEWLHDHLPAHMYAGAWLDVAGNLHVDNRTHNGHKTLFVAHVDTVHRKTGANKIRKTDSVWYADGAALGADDGVGCALLMHLLHAGVPGYYVFTQAEEVGGIGAKHLARHYPQLLAEFDRAIAFDRRGTDSVISHQGWGRCCSDVFAAAMAAELNSTHDELMYSPDDTGVYTDTAEFVDIIPECTNISCGYDHEHSDREELDIVHFDRLSAAVLNIDWDALPTERDPKFVEPDPITNSYSSWWKTSPHVPTDIKSMFDEEDDDTLNEDDYLLECLLDAAQGFKENIVALIAASVYPEDTDLAMKLIDRKRLTDDALSAAMDMVGKYDVDSVLATLFDAAYAE